MIYVLYDKPKKIEDMSFLTSAFESDYEEIYPGMRCVSIEQMLKVCEKTVIRTMNGDTIVCWYDFMGVLCWWLGKLTHKKIKVVAINILLKDKKTIKNRIAKFLYREALTAESFIATVTTREYGNYINSILNTDVKFPLLHDVYHNTYVLNEKVREQKNTVFCGGRNGRDWNMLFCIADALPNVTFHCVMPHKIYKQFVGEIRNNIIIKTDVTEKEFMKMLCQSQFVVMPLDTEAPAGLTVYFQAAANDKLIITSDSVTTKAYLSDGRGVLCGKNVEDWVNKIRYYLSNIENAENSAIKFKNFLERECSEDKYAKTLWEILDG